jgi:hypothetical protein
MKNVKSKTSLFGVPRGKNKAKRTLEGPSIVVAENRIIGALKTENSFWYAALYILYYQKTECQFRQKNGSLKGQVKS